MRADFCSHDSEREPRTDRFDIERCSSGEEEADGRRHGMSSERKNNVKSHLWQLYTPRHHDGLGGDSSQKIWEGLHAGQREHHRTLQANVWISFSPIQKKPSAIWGGENTVWEMIRGSRRSVPLSRKRDINKKVSGAY